jgi:hypothetical protein
MKPKLIRASAYIAALLACLAVFAWYLQPDMVLAVADRIWACF